MTLRIHAELLRRCGQVQGFSELEDENRSLACDIFIILPGSGIAALASPEIFSGDSPQVLPTSSAFPNSL